MDPCTQFHPVRPSSEKHKKLSTALSYLRVLKVWRSMCHRRREGGTWAAGLQRKPYFHTSLRQCYAYGEGAVAAESGETGLLSQWGLQWSPRSSLFFASATVTQWNVFSNFQDTKMHKIGKICINTSNITWSHLTGWAPWPKYWSDSSSLGPVKSMMSIHTFHLQESLIMITTR